MSSEDRRSYYPTRATEKQAEDIGRRLDRLAFCFENDELVAKHILHWLDLLPDLP